MLQHVSVLHSFYGWITFHYMDILCFVRLFLFGLFPLFSYHEYHLTVLQVFVWTLVFISFRYILRKEIDGSSGNSMLNFFEELLNFFCSGCTILQAHWQCMRVPIFPYPCRNFFLIPSLFLSFPSFVSLKIKDFLVGVEQYLIMVLICISLIASDVEYFSSYWLPVYLLRINVLPIFTLGCLPLCSWAVYPQLAAAQIIPDLTWE